jgi:hypothetical protein
MKSVCRCSPLPPAEAEAAYYASLEELRNAA